jgi:hypothetical protein
MIKHSSVLSFAAIGAVLGAGSVPAQAQSQFNFVPLGLVTYTPPSPSTVDLATSVTAPGPYVTTPPQTGFFSGLGSGKPVTLSNDTFSTGSSTDFTLHYAGDTFTFTGSPGLLTGNNNGTDATATWTEFGFLTDTKGYITTPGGALGQLSFQAVQNLALFSPNPSGSFVFTSLALPGPPPLTPEPGSVAMLAALGMSGISFLARRRRK